MKHLKYILFLWAASFGTGLMAQTASVDRVDPLVDFGDPNPLTSFCGTQTLTYNVTISTLGSSINQGDIVIEETFGTCNCYQLSIVTPPPPGQGTLTIIGGNTIRYESPAVLSGALSLSFEIGIAGDHQNGTISSCTLTTGGPTFINLPTNYTPSVFVGSVPIVPPFQETAVLTGVNKWVAQIHPCVQQTGLNCFRYQVDIRGRSWSNDCNAMNLWSYIGSNHDFAVPTGGVIQQVVNATSSLNNLTSAITGNTAVIRVNPTSPGGIFEIQEGYRFYIDVEYPCDLFPPDGTTTYPVSISGSQTSNFPNVIFQPSSCPPSSMVPDVIQGSNIAHTMDPLETDASLSIFPTNFPINSSPRFPATGHQSPGCQNAYDIQFCNRGNTILTNVQLELNPIPTGIIPISFQGGTIEYSVNNGPYTTTPPAQMSQVTGVRWLAGELGPGLQCDPTTGPVNCLSRRFCYQIAPTVAIGTQIPFCVNATFGQRDSCMGPNCPPNTTPPPPFPLPLTSCDTLEVIAPIAVPRIIKTIQTPHPPNPPLSYFGSAFPGEWVTYKVQVKNCGDANLLTTILDNIPNSLENVTIDSYRYRENGAAFQPGNNGWVLSSNVTGNLVSIDVDIPGNCQLYSCNQICNTLEVTLEGQVKLCELPRRVPNHAQLSPQNITSQSAIFELRNYNQLIMNKKGKGDLTSNYTDITEATIGGPVDFKVVIVNTDPVSWYDPVIVDVLPDVTPARTFEGNAIPNSMFNMNLRQAVTSADVIHIPNLITNLTIEHGNFQTAYTDNDLSNGANPANYICGPYVSGSCDRAVKFSFEGEIPCGDSIVIIIPAEVAPTALNGQTAQNMVFKVEKSNPTGTFTPITLDNAEVRIRQWQLDCCDSASVSVNAVNPNVYQDYGDHWKSVVNFTMQTASAVPIQRIRASIIDLQFYRPGNDSAACFLCKNHFGALGTYPWWGAPDITGVSGGPLVNVVQPSNGPPWTGNRERIWEVGVNGFPLDMSNPITYPVWFQLPKIVNLPCCNGEVILCIKWEFTDANCHTCETIECVHFQLP